ncbi:4Fe-4S binding protein [Shewanella sp. PP-He15 brown]|uniref:4Fe-4S ferredoxin iron-sulfur binding domain protein n=1 Tax=Shewanella baltica (strain OS195) TaxID=399599 RepID=A9KX99_SHEB9|nr:4Fe-4S binding protein [Shewanella baltica]ABX47495.1 4Fe-4S ferredoxin iron-sulfur binding domain protein [Shewanella baltica OS195]ADT92521.1 4Fe-4S ferredoxin iron-sulfur binding domain-containing protein [Shewanella baltica OS678]EHC05089.1 4Fe-4S ferredoxin iron-sulfur binding domain-containing protein [Shewanella baltica OS625]
MTFIESLTLMLALMYLASLSYWSGQKWGAVATLLLSVGAVAISLYWPLALGLIIALPLALLGHKFAPDSFKGEIKINTLRQGTQHVLALSLLLVAVQYTINTILLKQGITPWLMRPDVVDAFLPIAGGIELKAIVSLNLWDQTHPAAAVMLAAVLLTGLLCKRAFCGWACPLGLAGEYLYAFRKRFIKSELTPPAWLDWPLRMLKYLLLLGLCYIVIGMPAQSIPNYLEGNYHKIADLKMALFFLTPSLITLLVFALILALAAWRRQGFCRYLCPYGAILGILSFASPLKIRRDSQHCLIEAKGMKCDKCTRACPANIIVHTKTTVRSDECQACMRCVAACPKSAALGLGLKSGHRLGHKGLLALVLIALFILPLGAYLAGFWHSQTPDNIRMELIQVIDRVGH